MATKPELARLIVAPSETDADMLYATRIFIGDPFIFLQQKGKRTLVLSDLEIDRAKKNAKADEFVMFNQLEREVQGKAKKAPAYEKVLAHFLTKRGVEILKASKPGTGKKLKWSGKTLTSETLRAEIDSAILRAGGVPTNTIVAGGDQACDPHERGFGPLRADSLIILDIFPRDGKTGYWGDMTRTVVRGRGSEQQRQLR